jgi:putative peptidoglycan lipid II flippase
LPAISRSAEHARIAEFRETLSRSLGLVFLLTIPSAVGLIVLSRPLVGIVYQRGQFLPSDTEQTAIALSYYSLGLAGYAAIKVLTPAYYALNDVRIPMAASLASIALNYMLNWTFVRVLDWGHGGLAFSTSLVATFNFLALFWFMRQKVHGIEGRRLAWGVSKICLASALMGAMCALSSFAVRSGFGESAWARLLDLSVSVPLGLLVLYRCCRALGVQELDLAQQATLGRIRGPARRPSEPYDRIDADGF